MGILDRITKGSADAPDRTLLYGVEGIGKSTWASKAPAPIFACSEDGLGPALVAQERVPLKKFDELVSLVDELRATQHAYKNLVIDTADWLEALLYEFVGQRDGFESSFGEKSYQRGYNAMQRELRLLLAKLETLRDEKRMGIIFLAHALIKPFNNPAGENYDRYVLKGNEKITGLLREWCDIVLFAKYDVYFKKVGGRQKAIGEARLVYTQWTRAWDAKNRHGLPESLPLDWDAFQTAIEAGRAAASAAGEDGGELAAEVAQLFGAAVFPNAALKKKALERLGGKLDVASLLKCPLKQLQAAADYLRTLQPAKEEPAAAAA